MFLLIIKLFREYKEDNVCDKYIEYDINGSKLDEYRNEDGSSHGKYLEYYENG